MTTSTTFKAAPDTDKASLKDMIDLPTEGRNIKNAIQLSSSTVLEQKLTAFQKELPIVEGVNDIYLHVSNVLTSTIRVDTTVKPSKNPSKSQGKYSITTDSSGRYVYGISAHNIYALAKDKSGILNDKLLAIQIAITLAFDKLVIATHEHEKSCLTIGVYGQITVNRRSINNRLANLGISYVKDRAATPQLIVAENAPLLAMINADPNLKKLLAECVKAFKDLDLDELDKRNEYIKAKLEEDRERAKALAAAASGEGSEGSESSVSESEEQEQHELVKHIIEMEGLPAFEISLNGRHIAQLDKVLEAIQNKFNK